MLCRGTGVFTDVFTLSGKATVDLNCAPPNDCPTYVSSCHIYYRWLTKCEWIWCGGFADQTGWVLGDGKTRLQFCENGKQQYKLEYMTTFTTPAVKTMKAFGENETVLEIGGSIIYRLIARGWANITNSTGYSYGTLLKTITATTGNTDPGAVATSGGSWITLCC
jgi:hypothetical protein